MGGTVAEPELERESPFGDAVGDVLQGAGRMIGGFVQVMAGITRLVLVAVVKADEANRHALEATQEEEKPKPKRTPKPKATSS
jgi:hypothetical protein